MSDGNIRIIEMPAADAVEDNDFLAIDNNSVAQSNDDTTAGTRKVRAKDFVQASLTVDETPTEDSENLVTSGGVYDALADVYDNLTSVAVYGASSGSIATFDDGADNPIKELTAQIEPVQDLHGYDAPWVGGGGKNKMPTTLADWASSSYSEYGVTLSIQSDGGIKINGTSSYSGDLRITIPVNFTIPSGSWTLSMTGANANIRWISTGNNGFNYTSKYGDFTQTYTITDTATPQYLYIDIASGVAINTILYIQLESGTSKTDYAPYENICPISGWDGANVEVDGFNIFDNSTFVKGRLDNGVIGYADNTTAMTITDSGVDFTTNANYRGVVGGLVRVKPNTNYYFNADYSGSISLTKSIDFYDMSGNWISRTYPFSDPFTTPTNCGYIRIAFQLNTSGSASITNIAVNVSDPNKNGTYEPYNTNSTTYPISWSDEAGTVYGGNFKLFKDGGKWYCTVNTTHEIINMGAEELTWAYTSGDHSRMTVTLSNAKGAPSGVTYSGMCSVYKSTSYNAVYNHQSDKIIGISDNGTVWVYDSNYTDASAFKTAMQNLGAQLCYELATPTTTTFEIDTEIATLLGVNNIFADCGDVDVTYQRDLNIVINKLLQG